MKESQCDKNILETKAEVKCSVWRRPTERMKTERLAIWAPAVTEQKSCESLSKTSRKMGGHSPKLGCSRGDLKVPGGAVHVGDSGAGDMKGRCGMRKLG